MRYTNSAQTTSQRRIDCHTPLALTSFFLRTNDITCRGVALACAFAVDLIDSRLDSRSISGVAGGVDPSSAAVTPATVAQEVKGHYQQR
jgi:hypothetical protein